MEAMFTLPATPTTNNDNDNTKQQVALAPDGKHVYILRTTRLPAIERDIVRLKVSTDGAHRHDYGCYCYVFCSICEKF